jgi:membrane fusion protein, multidrug efflux system
MGHRAVRRLGVTPCRAGALALAALLLPWRAALGAEAAAPPLPVVAAARSGGAMAVAYDAVVEALRHTVIAAQVQGAVVRLAVKAGDRVAAGQLLLQLDERAAAQSAQASAAQAQAARATLDMARADYDRQRSLHADRFISDAALDHARAEWRMAQAQAGAQLAQAGAARTQASFYAVRAPYAGVVAEVPVTLGDMALPGRALVALYDPKALRVSAAVPQSVASRLAESSVGASVELPALPAERRRQMPVALQVLPAADAATHTVTVRADLAPGLSGMVPGQFARLWLPGEDATRAGAWVPASAVVRRAEMVGLYVPDAQGRALLRQVRLGRREGGRVEVLSGLAVGERVVTDPQAAAARAVAAR